ncbi:dockerin type I repeat-containing protein [Chitinispirillales bacterium ANBcel5]|uniref:dockerin type I repeat-containing protein n=1 Tax=Cellulosispirillum alkaliphilum TaxID=3039283 RepID=UPI002A540158|nr:dockerin type I repeat-containing protein [Chitinispirillales bacterium ANBcel5]
MNKKIISVILVMGGIFLNSCSTDNIISPTDQNIKQEGSLPHWARTVTFRSGHEVPGVGRTRFLIEGEEYFLKGKEINSNGVVSQEGNYTNTWNEAGQLRTAVLRFKITSNTVYNEHDEPSFGRPGQIRIDILQNDLYYADAIDIWRDPSSAFYDPVKISDLKFSTVISTPETDMFYEMTPQLKYVEVNKNYSAKPLISAVASGIEPVFGTVNSIFNIFTNTISITEKERENGTIKLYDSYNKTYSKVKRNNYIIRQIGYDVVGPLRRPQGKNIDVDYAGFTYKVTSPTDGYVRSGRRNVRHDIHFTIEYSNSQVKDRLLFHHSYETGGNTIMFGDVNNDGVIDSNDLVILKRYLLEIPVAINLAAADLNGDGIVDSTDYVILKRYILEQIPSLPL